MLPQVPEPEPEPEQPSEAQAQLLDEAGHELCLKFAGGKPGQCRFGAQCHRSHATPSAASLEHIKRLVAARSLEADAVAQSRLADAAAALSTPLPEWLHSSRTELVFSTAVSSHYERLRVAVCRFLRAGGEQGVDEGEPGLTLAGLHTLRPEQHSQPPLCPTLVSAYGRAGMSLPATWAGGGEDESKPSRRKKKDLKVALAERQRRFEQSEDYLEYVRDSLSLSLARARSLALALRRSGCGMQVHSSFQGVRRRDRCACLWRRLRHCVPVPTLAPRAHARQVAGESTALSLSHSFSHTNLKSPCAEQTIGMHCDSDYEHHQSAEINFWVPLTDVYGRCAQHSLAA